FLNLEGVNFVEPIYELPLGAEQGKLDLDVGWFDVRLLPTANPGELRWQIMLINRKDGRLYSYSVGRTEEGWFAFDSSSVSSDGKVVLPSQVAQLMLNGEAVQLAGAPTATVYNKHEAMRASNHEKLKMQNSYRYMLVAEAVEPAGKKVCVVSLDSSLSRE